MHVYDIEIITNSQLKEARSLLSLDVECWLIVIQLLNYTLQTYHYFIAKLKD